MEDRSIPSTVPRIKVLMTNYPPNWTSENSEATWRRVQIIQFPNWLGHLDHSDHLARPKV